MPFLETFLGTEVALGLHVTQTLTPQPCVPQVRGTEAFLCCFQYAKHFLLVMRLEQEVDTKRYTAAATLA